MHAKRVRIKDFRNFIDEEVCFNKHRNIIVGQNAQGKTNLLEAIEFASRGKSPRTANDFELIRYGSPAFSIELDFESVQGDENLFVSVAKNLTKTLKSGACALEKRAKINGASYNSTRKLAGNFVTVSFKSEDLNLLRGGPKYRRDWLDNLTSTLKKAYSQDLSKYSRTTSQKNRLLKDIFEKGFGSGSNQIEDLEQLKTWNQQAALLGARVVKQRLTVLNNLLPVAMEEHSKISGKKEILKAEYYLKRPDDEADGEDGDLEEVMKAGIEPDEKDIARRCTGSIKNDTKKRSSVNKAWQALTETISGSRSTARMPRPMPARASNAASSSP